MSLVVVTGGARSGKSGAAERLAAMRGRPVVVAVAGRAEDEEMTRRIAAHRADRPVAFETLEIESDVAWIANVPEESCLVLECIGTLVSLIVAEESTEDGEVASAGAEDQVQARTEALLDALIARRGDTIVVTNEVGDGVVPAYPSGRLFRDTLGRANRRLVERADGAWIVVAGRCLDLRTLPPDIAWPRGSSPRVPA
jgi:adenosylcobinamide kinase / adenosylcobinamide-phosphate guanylyltransferase